MWSLGWLEGGGAMRNGGWRFCDGEQGLDWRKGEVAIGNEECRKCHCGTGGRGTLAMGDRENCSGERGLGAEMGERDWEQREMAMGGWGYGNGETGLGAGGVAMGKLKGEQADLKAVTGTFIHAQRHVNDVLKVLPRDQICP